MSFQKVSKEEWLNLNQEEKDHLTFEFNKSVEKRRKFGLYLTRGIAIVCVLALFYIGYAQIEATKSYGKIKEQYGDNAYCYLCGVESLRRCDCIYWSQDFKPSNMTQYKNDLGNYNSKVCEPYKPDIIGYGSFDINAS